MSSRDPLDQRVSQDLSAGAIVKGGVGGALERRRGRATNNKDSLTNAALENQACVIEA
jgi:hypothetical protein